MQVRAQVVDMSHRRVVLVRRTILLVLLFALAWLAPTPSATPPDRAAAAPVMPTIVLVLTDDQTIEAVDRMPYVSSRTDWHRFTNAIVNNSLCCPSRATTLTGQYDTRTGVVHNLATGAFRDAQTLPVWLQAAGYRTGLFGKYLNNYPAIFGHGDSYVPPGWNDWRAVFGPVNLTQYNYNLNENGVVRTYGTAPADYLVDVLRQRAVDFIRSSPASQPLFVYFTPTSTHEPWKPAPRYTNAFSGVTMPRYPNSNEADVSDKPAWVRALPRPDMTVQDNHRRRAWRAALAVDDAVREIDAALAATGRLANTVFIYASDNGLAFGSHRWTDKRCPYEECHHVPMLVRYPGTPGQTDARLVSNVDLASTIAAIAGATPGIQQDGRSLVPLLTGATVTGWRTGVLQHWPGGDEKGQNVNRPVPASYGIRTVNYRYVELATGERELYDLRSDPYELRNVAGTAAYATTQANLRTQLAALKAAEAD
jgi:arylsulfatase A-like enzyme